MAIQISGAVCLHIPKTGGTWIRHYFQESGLDHNRDFKDFGVHTHGEIISAFIGPTEDLFFCFVRHPLTWLRSYWIHKVRLTPDSREHKILDDIVDLPFNEFVDIIVKDYPGYLTGFFNGYTNRCRFIGKMENLRRDLDNVLRYLRFPYDREYLFTRPKQNVNPSDPCKYTMEQALALMAAEKETVNKYNYNYLPLDIIDV